ncbi:MAG TPA: MarR family transcriptional regulator [Oligoflexia bacterium]|nr:MarR family transcriptional regulator [Oligoflexia bacterium]HMR24934.1 MarR family transcriptional regulator [Oligoflexia bacterium]
MISSQWTFFSNHAHVLFILYQHPNITMKDISTAVGITERAVHKIIKELEAFYYIKSKKEGRRNTYTLNLNKPLRHKIEKHCKIKDLIQLISLEDKK